MFVADVASAVYAPGRAKLLDGFFPCSRRIFTSASKPPEADVSNVNAWALADFVHAMDLEALWLREEAVHRIQYAGEAYLMTEIHQ